MQSVEPSGTEIIDSPLIDIFDLKDIKCANPLMIYSDESLSGAEVIARTINGNACGFVKNLEKGSLIHLGTWIGFDTEGHKPVYEAILNRSDAKLRQSSTNNENIAIRQRFTDDHSSILFIGNYYNEEHEGKITYTHPKTGEAITVPYLLDKMLWPALYAVLSPICLNVANCLKILHSTSDILNVEESDGQLKITLFGDRDLLGEMVFEGKNISKVKSVSLDGDGLDLIWYENRIVLNYNHKYRTEMSLTVKIS